MQSTAVLMGMRDILRDAFAQAGQRGEHTISWRLRIGSIQQLADDTERVLGYRPRVLNSFLGLPIEICPIGAPNELITSAGSVSLSMIPDPAAARR